MIRKALRTPHDFSAVMSTITRLSGAVNAPKDKLAVVQDILEEIQAERMMGTLTMGGAGQGSRRNTLFGNITW